MGHYCQLITCGAVLISLLRWCDAAEDELYTTLTEVDQRFDGGVFNLLKHDGVKWLPQRTWQSRQLSFNPPLSEVNYLIYKGSNGTALREQHSGGWTKIVGRFITARWWWESYLNPFYDTYVGISSPDNFNVRLKVTQFDIRLFSAFVSGLLLFMSARTLSRQVAFYYASGVGIGVCATVLILLYAMYRRLNRPPDLVKFTMAFVAPAQLALFYLFYNNATYLLTTYPYHFAVFVTIVALVSFAVLYKWGPPQDHRTLDLIKWTIQGIGLILIFTSCQYLPVAVATCALCCLLQTGILGYVPGFGFFSRLRYRFFPPKRKLLTMEEYEEQGRIETAKALRELQSFAQSPDCSPWKTVSRIHDPKRFASFIEGSFHVTEEEDEDHDATCDVFPQNDFDDRESISSDGSVGREMRENEDISGSSNFNRSTGQRHGKPTTGSQFYGPPLHGDIRRETPENNVSNGDILNRSSGQRHGKPLTGSGVIPGLRPDSGRFRSPPGRDVSGSPARRRR